MLSRRMGVMSQFFKEKRLSKLKWKRKFNAFAVTSFHFILVPMQHVGDAVPISRGLILGSLYTQCRAASSFGSQVRNFTMKCVKKPSVGLIASQCIFMELW